MCLQIKTSLVVLNEDNKNQTLVQSRRSYGLIKEKKNLGNVKVSDNLCYCLLCFFFYTKRIIKNRFVIEF